MTKKQRLVFCTAAVIIVAAVMLSQAVINTAVMKSDIASRVLRLHKIMRARQDNTRFFGYFRRMSKYRRVRKSRRGQPR